jgi:hypothetical protein
MQYGSKLSYSKYPENCPEKNTWRMGNKVVKLRSHTSSNTAYCEIPKKRGGQNVPCAIHIPLDPIFHPIADCLENQFREHDLCDCDLRWHLEPPVEALLVTVDGDIHVNLRPYDVSK